MTAVKTFGPGAIMVLVASMASAAVDVATCEGTPGEALAQAFRVAQGLETGCAGGFASRVVTVPPGSYVIDSPLDIVGALDVRGVQGATNLVAASGLQYVIRVQSNEAVLISGLSINAYNMPPGSSAITVSGRTTEAQLFMLERVSIWNAQTAVSLLGTSKAKLSGVYIKQYKQTGVYIRNEASPDVGSARIEGSWMATTHPGTVGVWWRSGGGLTVTSTAIKAGHTGILIDPLGPADSTFGGQYLTSVIVVDGCSVEHQSYDSIRISKSVSDPLTVSQVIISNSQFAGSPTGILVVDLSRGDLGPWWLQGLVVSGNTFSNHDSAAVALYEVAGVAVTGNSFLNSTHGVYVYGGTDRQTAVGVEVSGNSFVGVQYPGGM